MVGNWIPSGGDTTRLPGQLRQLVQQLQQANALASQLSAIMSQMVGGGTDYTTVETYFNIPTGSGSAVSAIVGTVSTDLNGSNIQGLLQRLG